MKWTSLTLDLSKIRKLWQRATAMLRTMGTLVLCTFLLFLLIGLAAFANSKLDRAPVSPMKGWAAAISNAFFIDAMGLEIPHLQKDPESSSFSESSMFSFAFRLLTDVNLKDPRTFLAREVPGLNADKAILLRKPAGTGDDFSGPEDYTPSENTGKGTDPGFPDPNAAAQSPSPSDHPEPDSTPQPTGEKASSPKPAATPKAGHSTDEKIVLIYSSHNRESYLPNLNNVTDPDKAYSAKTNVTLVGDRLAAQLEKRGVGAVNYNTDYTSVVKNFNYLYSYKYSNKTVKEAFAAHPEIKFVFDVHRDSLKRSKTTATINGKAYAQIYFIIGQRNPHWQKNEAFAAQIHELLENRMPGLSRGIWGKTPHEGNAEYNQTLADNSVLVEIGGPYNSLEECYRTADILAEVIAELANGALKADAPQASSGKEG
ncbi:stage II sporulation protein P [Gorillibacterium timonense]|uniref:stage II sporulation protein P n=1 Tax=Gorillibacterium timonense TaxID=1689269 RepID=UPI00071D4599|nr:stage II sporulation protein P [Gorillibacterium timonense]